MDGPGTITWEEFLRDAEAMVKISNEIKDGWELIGEKDSPGMAYLCRQVKTFVPSDYPIDDSKTLANDEENFCWMENTAEDPFEAVSKDERPLITVHHVLWSMSYGVPVLYFNGWKSDFTGYNAVSVEAAQNLSKTQDLGYSELSQGVHPILGTPFLQLHPCKSQELIAHLWKSKNKLVSWLSATGPSALQLKLHQDYYKLTI